MDRIGKFLYFPSFSAGEFGHGLLKNHKFRGEQTVRFYSDEFPEQFRTKQFLITAGANFRRPTFREDMGFTKDNLLLGDSGGYQMASCFEMEANLNLKSLSGLKTILIGPSILIFLRD